MAKQSTNSDDVSLDTPRSRSSSSSRGRSRSRRRSKSSKKKKSHKSSRSSKRSRDKSSHHSRSSRSSKKRKHRRSKSSSRSNCSRKSRSNSMSSRSSGVSSYSKSKSTQPSSFVGRPGTGKLIYASSFEGVGGEELPSYNQFNPTQYYQPRVHQGAAYQASHQYLVTQDNEYEQSARSQGPNSSVDTQKMTALADIASMLKDVDGNVM